MHTCRRRSASAYVPKRSSSSFAIACRFRASTEPFGWTFVFVGSFYFFYSSTKFSGSSKVISASCVSTNSLFSFVLFAFYDSSKKSKNSKFNLEL